MDYNFKGELITTAKHYEHEYVLSGIYLAQEEKGIENKVEPNKYFLKEIEEDNILESVPYFLDNVKESNLDTDRNNSIIEEANKSLVYLFYINKQTGLLDVRVVSKDMYKKEIEYNGLVVYNKEDIYIVSRYIDRLTENSLFVEDIIYANKTDLAKVIKGFKLNAGAEIMLSKYLRSI